MVQIYRMGLLKAFVDTDLNILQFRKTESLTPDIKKIIDILTIDSKSPPQIVGSFQYKAHEYPSDIDLYEPVHGCCNFDISTKKIAKKIQGMVKKLQAKRFTYIGDFKAGIDNRYFINIGSYDPEKNKLKGYDQYKIVERIADIYKQRLLTKTEALDLIQLTYDNPNAYQYQKLRDAVRKRYILRWTTDELLQGSKDLILGEKITLEEAISQGTIVKIDVWALIDDRFMEITNWFLLVANIEGQDIYLSEKPDMYQKSLKREILLFKNPLFKKHMKLAKRMWLYAISEKDSYTIGKLYPLFSSPIAKMNQIQSELEILIGMLKQLKSPPYYLINKQVAMFKTRIGTVPDIYLKDTLSSKIFKYLDNTLSANKDNTQMIENLENALLIIQDIVDRDVKKYLYINIPRNNILKLLIKIIQNKSIKK